MTKSLLSTADALFDLYHLERLPRVDQIKSRPIEPNLLALTPLELQWLREDEQEELT